MVQSTDLIRLPVISKLGMLIEALEPTSNIASIYSILEDIVELSARFIQGDLEYNYINSKIAEIGKHVYMNTNGLELEAISILLRELIEEYGSMILTYHIPVQNISLVNYDTLNMNIANREAIEDGTVTQEI